MQVSTSPRRSRLKLGKASALDKLKNTNTMTLIMSTFETTATSSSILELLTVTSHHSHGASSDRYRCAPSFIDATVHIQTYAT
jgi:hypothetical protein